MNSAQLPPPRFARHVQRVALALLALLLAALLAEGACRLGLRYLATESSYVRFAPLDQLLATSRPDIRRDYRLVPHRYVGYVGRPNLRYKRGPIVNQHNSLGYRDDELAAPKPPEERRVVCLGGSFTYGESVYDWRGSYPRRLAVLLHRQGYEQLRVLNAGVPWYTSWESVVDLQFRLLPLQPDLLIVECGLDDVASRLVWPPPAYHGDNTGSRLAIPDNLVTPGLEERSLAWRMLLILTGHYKPPRYFEDTPVAEAPTACHRLFAEQLAQKTYPAGLFQQVNIRGILDANPPTFFERNLENLLRLAQSEGVQCVLTTCSSSLWANTARPERQTPEYEYALAQHNQVIRTLSARLKVPLDDWAAAFPAAATAAEPVVVEARPERVAGHVAMFLEQQHLLGRRIESATATP